MDGQTSKSKPSFKCVYCGKAYRKESTLLAHMCEKKRRIEQEKEVGVQLGLMAYRKFYAMKQQGSPKRTYQDFMDSQFYLAFVKFGRHIKLIRALKPERYMEWLISEGKKLDHWCRDTMYEQYLHHLIRKENPNDTLQRALEVAMEWADESGAEFHHYFLYQSSNQICRQIMNGMVSPWIVYNCDSGVEFLQKLNEEQLGLIYKFIEPEYWQTRFTNYPGDTAYIQETLKEAGL